MSSTRYPPSYPPSYPPPPQIDIPPAAPQDVKDALTELRRHITTISASPNASFPQVVISTEVQNINGVADFIREHSGALNRMIAVASSSCAPCLGGDPSIEAMQSLLAKIHKAPDEILHYESNSKRNYLGGSAGRESDMSLGRETVGHAKNTRSTILGEAVTKVPILAKVMEVLDRFHKASPSPSPSPILNLNLSPSVAPPLPHLSHTDQPVAGAMPIFRSLHTAIARTMGTSNLSINVSVSMQEEDNREHRSDQPGPAQFQMSSFMKYYGFPFHFSGQQGQGNHPHYQEEVSRNSNGEQSGSAPGSYKGLRYPGYE
ncbi:hypothetical protein BU17DRAFT_65131 [Hysterangium stoloniferum]|nr:hypothetical protein BU17DRAFT_65131 [Hysterangium stoloniferum]